MATGRFRGTQPIRFRPLIRVTLGVGHPADNPDVPYDLIVRTVAMPAAAH